ncbi:3-oxoacyl-[acyl-carrier-protein] synthase III C-terminal domain-containing protein [Actinomadura rubrisoli]|uniref:Beta-ketoacyl-[acyl-carrier-protein] synthase III C-terminal domain-containing protein n=1 Tax=Actinomadura rubrisoli TaxID=2530368 RepID=A0A4R5C6R1_9ACTN|nr:3-oxoacyl-[acyl-carrier-protein] synthase III C-terminal domain-containing protein [Actinomadura rubrisoli]TDD93803.1 hypothetical protein E1298_08465 [Actinomadura rubrisoli]
MEMAERAALRALAHSQHSPKDIAGVIAVDVSGYDHHAPAMRIQRTVGSAGIGYELRNASASDLAAIFTAADRLTCDPTSTALLIAAADRFALPKWNRWRDGGGIILGDAGAALVLSRSPGFARVVAGAYGSAPELEHYGRYSRTRAVRGHDTYSSFGESAETLRHHTRAVIEAALADTDVSHVDHVAITGVGRHLIAQLLPPELCASPYDTTWSYSRNIGHTCADITLGLAHLLRSGRLSAGDHVLAIGLAVGFSFYAVVLRVEETGPPGKRLQHARR